MQCVAIFLQEHFRSITGVVLLGLLGAALALGVQWAQDPYRFPLRVVKVDGELRYLDREHLQTVVAPFVQGGFFTVDVATICMQVENLPWVYKARVARSWPDGLSVTISEQQPVARWGERGYLNRFGEPFIPVAGAAVSDLPALSGPQGHEQAVLEKYRQITRILKPLGLAVAGVRLDARRAWHLETVGGMQLELGRADIWQRLQRFVRAWPTVLATLPQGAQRVDLRYSNGFSVYRQQAETTLPGKQTQRG
jgi:cell division protein FtsQ